MRASVLAACVFTIPVFLNSSSAAADPPVIPHGQKAAPGDPLSPAEAIGRMKVPGGFKVELVASEPDIVNPVAMTFDERGRIWITESLEYPRKDAGRGRDRVKILEDVDGDGKADTFTVFADGLNIPSGIAVGHGGVWVANSPDLLLLRDTDGDGKADTREVVVTGFGREDTHELPNSLTWGPDGWLYGWNGVFNASRVVHRGKTYEFTCAIFRIHPRTREFEVFCEGTSNPWGIAFDAEGSAFASACVIDHLWHLVETGYYHRQGGPYPPYTWKIESIVDHKHQQAAYCGIHYFDSDAYPPAYRGKLFMGNIHGNCINVDRLRRSGSTYVASAEPDFLAANDPWFMPVSQKTGPDGCLYVLDWYDRYHCYQDANRDPAGIDRLKGRLYRVRYNDAPRAPRFDLASESDHALVLLLGSPNIYFRDTAQRLLAERNTPTIRSRLETLVLDGIAPRKSRMHALWALLGCGDLKSELLEILLSYHDPGFRAWAVRAAGNQRRLEPELRARLASVAADASPDVRLQVAIASRKIESVDPIPVLLDVISRADGDTLVPRIVWSNLLPLLDDPATVNRFMELVRGKGLNDRSTSLTLLIPRVIERLLGRSRADASPIASLLALLAAGGTESARSATHQTLVVLASRVQSGELTGASLDAFRAQLEPVLGPLLARGPEDPVRLDATILAASWGDPQARSTARDLFARETTGEDVRLRCLNSLIARPDPGLVDAAANSLTKASKNSVAFRGQVLASLGKLEDPRVAEVVLGLFPTMEPELQPKAVELLTQRGAWSAALVDAIGKGSVPRAAVNLNQVRKLLASKDQALVKRVDSLFGTVREGRNPERERVIGNMRTFLRNTPGDAIAGVEVFKKVCAQCHKLHGEGQDVGPDITSNGRGSYEQLLSNVFDPSLVIGAAFQGTTVATKDGRVLAGLLVEETPGRVVLKLQGGKLETIPRGEVDEVKLSPLSLMPEDLEKQLTPQELADLFAFITLDKHPRDPTAKSIPGADEVARSPRSR